METETRNFETFAAATRGETMRSEKPVPSCPVTVRCYDNGGRSFDRYTVVYHGNQVRRRFGWFAYLAMSENPSHPQGFGQHGGADYLIDSPRYSHLGKRIPFAALPEPCRALVISDLIVISDLSV